MAKITFHIRSTTALSDFFKRFTSVDNSLLLEITPDQLKAKVHTTDKTVVKTSSISLDEVFHTELTEGKVPQILKVGFLNVPRLIDSFSQFDRTDGISMTVEYEPNPRSKSEMAGTSVVLHGGSLTLTFTPCSLEIFHYISDDDMARFADTSESVFTISISADEMKKLLQLCRLDSESLELEVSSEGDGVIFSGRSFTYRVPDAGITGECSVKIFKRHFALVGSSSVAITVLPSKIVFRSPEGDSAMVIGTIDV